MNCHKYWLVIHIDCEYLDSFNTTVCMWFAPNLSGPTGEQHSITDHIQLHKDTF